MGLVSGPAMSVLTACAAAVGAGVVLGGFVVGVVSLLLGWPARELDREVRDGGHVGGLVALALLCIDNIG
jgi:hypothetical protein